VLRVMLPCAIATTDIAGAVAALEVFHAVEAFVEVHVDVIAAPTGAPTPSAAPGSSHR
jgi:hypothetical protein